MENKKITLISFIWKYVSQFKLAFFLMTIFYSSYVLERVYFPYLIGGIIDKMTSIDLDPFKKINWRTYIASSLILAIFTVCIVDICVRVQEMIKAYVDPKFCAKIRSDVFKYALGQSARFFSEGHAGSIGTQVNMVSVWVNQVVFKITEVIISVFINMIASVIAIYCIDKKIGLIFLSVYISYFAILLLSTPIIIKYSMKSANKIIELEGKIVDAINCVLNIRLFARSKQEMGYYKKYQDGEINAFKNLELIKVIVRVFLSVALNLGLGFVVYYAILEWSKGNLSIGNFSTITFIVINASAIAWWIAYEMSSFFEACGKAKESLQLINEPVDVKDAPDAEGIKITEVKIEFKNVSFSHKNTKFFNDKNITIEPGQHVGLVGYSGAGKTTFVNLILREYNLDSGQILIDGQDIGLVTLDSLHKGIAFIAQDILLFHRTIRENLLIGRDGATEDEIRLACKNANALEFIEAMPDGLESDVGERGSKLSGGQRQRLAIARAFLKDSKIIILDEATSALDPNTENKIKDALVRLGQNRTMIVIAHRLSSLENMDRIIALNNGKIIEDGTHSELMSKNGFYASLWSAQGPKVYGGDVASDYYDFKGDEL